MAKKSSTPKLKSTEFDTIEAKKIVLKGGDGSTIELHAMDSGVGIWLRDAKTGAYVCIYAGMEQGAIMAVRSADATLGHNIAIGADKTEAQIQLVGDNDEDVRWFTATKLMSILEQGKGLL
jgi:hypothetical protein